MSRWRGFKLFGLVLGNVVFLRSIKYNTKSVSGNGFFAKSEEKVQNIEDATIYKGEMRRKPEFDQSCTRGND